jgi:hypothetical protein
MLFTNQHSKIQIRRKAHAYPKGFFLLLLTIAFLLPAGNTFAQKKHKKKKPSFTLGFKLATIYDDNILKYSDQYLQRFMNGEDEGRFHIKTYDDVIFYTALQFSSTFYVFGKQKSKIDAEYSRRTYAVNHIKDWNYFYVGFQQYLPARISFKISYSYIPDFYVRHFRDDQLIAILGYKPILFQPYAFSKDNYGLWLQKTFFKNTRLKLIFYYALYYHNEHYTEYDSKNLYYGFSLYQPVHKKVRLEFGYQFINSDAKGYDAAYETPETTLGPDATYAEDRFTLGVLWDLPVLFKMKHNINVKCGYQARYYSSKHPLEIDRLHAGRVDKNLRLYFNYNIKLNKSMRLRAYYYWYGRDSDTGAKINKTFISNEKDYRQNIFGLEFNYKLKFRKKSKKKAKH